MKIITRAVQQLVPATLVMRHTNVIAEGDEANPVDTDLLTLYAGAATEWAEDYLGGVILAPTLVEQTLAAFPADTSAIVLETETALSVVAVLYTDATGTAQVLDPAFTVLDTTTSPPTVGLAPAQAWPTAVQVSTADTRVRVRTLVGYSPVGDAMQAQPLPQRITTAICMVAAHLYKNRESTTAEALSLLPLGPIALLHPLRVNFGFA